MNFAADFSVRQGTHFSAGLGQEAVVFWAAFFDAGFGSIRAQRNEIAGDGQEHFVNESGDGSGFGFSADGGVCELAQSVEGAFEGESGDGNIMGEGGFLHDAADQIVGDEVHAQFAFDHVGREATEDIHVEVDLDLAEVEFDAPAAEVEFSQVTGGDICVQKGGDESDALGAEPGVGNGVANDPHGDAFRQEGELFRGHGRGALGRALPDHFDIKVGEIRELRADGLAHLILRQAHERVHSAGEQGGEGPKGAKTPVGNQ